MIIECPGCQETYRVDLPSLEPEGIEIQCKKCNRLFVIRPHGAQGWEESPAMNDQAPSSPVAFDEQGFFIPPKSAEIDTDLPESLFLQRDEIPYWMVLAYEEIEEKRARASFQDSEEIGHNGGIGGGRYDHPPDILIESEAPGDVDQLGGFVSEDSFSGSYPLGQEILIGKRRSARRLRLWVGVGVVAVVVVLIALFAGRCSGQEPWKAVKWLGKRASALMPFSRLESGRLQISGLNSYFQDRSGEESPVFVIEGNVTNHYQSPCHSIQVKGILFDERGNRVAEEVAYCGNLLTVKQIGSYPRKRIEQTLQNAYGSILSNFNIESGKSVAFMLVFFDPPEKLSEFSLEVYQYTLQEQGSG